jgi:hypothetical protein
MTSTKSNAGRLEKHWPKSGPGWLWKLSRALFLLVACAWATLALYYSNLPWASARLVLAAAFATFAVWGLFLYRRGWPKLIILALLLGVVSWFVAISPSHDRNWRKEVAIMPRAVIEGDRVRLMEVRNFDYRTRDDFDVHYEEREVRLSDLTSVDLFISYWAVGPVGHTFVSFNFDNTPTVCISIETRPEEGEGFDPLASMFKQFELAYVVGDERDLVRSRTNYRDEEVFLYRVKASPDAARRLFLVYLDRINQLADRPEWYHLLKNNCTLNIVRYANAAGREGSFDIRHLINGWFDRYAYRAGLLDTSLPFEELRQKSRINDAAEAADDDKDFSARIRASLPGMSAP